MNNELQKLREENEQLRERNKRLKSIINTLYGLNPYSGIYGGRGQGKTFNLKQFYKHYIENTKKIIEAFPVLKEDLYPNIEKAQFILNELETRFTYHNTDPDQLPDPHDIKIEKGIPNND